jgi:UDP-N-acetylglucosamine--N-acetylmuramyl-(pentapeptide) pyrophosphoryl-undecaprenol N-acetylglucosamine transferase
MFTRAGVDWVTFDTAQSRSLLCDEKVKYVRRVRPRELSSLLANVYPTLSILRNRRYDVVVASGSAGLTFLPLAAVFGGEAHFIECATRTTGPSLSGRLLAVFPWVRRYTQHCRWARGSWLYRGSVFDAYHPDVQRRSPRLERVVVTVGLNPYPFRRLLERLIAILPASAEVVWQTGETDTAGLPIHGRPTVAASDLDAAMAHADVVVAHAGTGSALAALDARRIPVLVPRLEALGEQVDDHQVLLAQELAERGLALARSVDQLDLRTLRLASMLSARRQNNPLPFELG